MTRRPIGSKVDDSPTNGIFKGGVNRIPSEMTTGLLETTSGHYNFALTRQISHNKFYVKSEISHVSTPANSGPRQLGLKSSN
jgi:hypothetical protein